MRSGSPGALERFSGAVGEARMFYGVLSPPAVRRVREQSRTPRRLRFLSNLPREDVKTSLQPVVLRAMLEMYPGRQVVNWC